MEREISFSIIMPTYNRKHCIKAAIDSLLNQTYQDFELIIIDDASADGTDECLLKEYQEEIKKGKIKFLKLKENKGPSFARNEGLKMAKNEWIGYLDSDNQMHKDFLETFVKNIKDNPATEIFYAQIKSLTTQNIIGHEFDFENLLLGNYIDVGILVHSKKIYSELGGFDMGIKGVEDWDLIIKYTEKYAPKFIQKVLLDYYDGSEFERITPNSNYCENFKKTILNYYNRLPAQEFFKTHINKNNELISKDQEIATLNQIVQQKEEHISNIVNSLRWRIPNYFYKMYKKLMSKIST
ncbi:MAG: glycosyltransferase family 2 protein [Parcubacteria group bacterium]